VILNDFRGAGFRTNVAKADIAHGNIQVGKEGSVALAAGGTTREGETRGSARGGEDLHEVGDADKKVEKLSGAEVRSPSGRDKSEDAAVAELLAYFRGDDDSVRAVSSSSGRRREKGQGDRSKRSAGDGWDRLENSLRAGVSREVSLSESLMDELWNMDTVFDEDGSIDGDESVLGEADGKSGDISAVGQSPGGAASRELRKHNRRVEDSPGGASTVLPSDEKSPGKKKPMACLLTQNQYAFLERFDEDDGISNTSSCLPRKLSSDGTVDIEVSGSSAGEGDSVHSRGSSEHWKRRQRDRRRQPPANFSGNNDSGLVFSAGAMGTVKDVRAGALSNPAQHAQHAQHGKWAVERHESSSPQGTAKSSGGGPETGPVQHLSSHALRNLENLRGLAERDPDGELPGDGPDEVSVGSYSSSPSSRVHAPPANAVRRSKRGGSSASSRKSSGVDSSANGSNYNARVHRGRRVRAATGSSVTSDPSAAACVSAAVSGAQQAPGDKQNSSRESLIPSSSVSVHPESPKVSGKGVIPEPRVLGSNASSEVSALPQIVSAVVSGEGSPIASPGNPREGKSVKQAGATQATEGAFVSKSGARNAGDVYPPTPSSGASRKARSPGSASSSKARTRSPHFGMDSTEALPHFGLAESDLTQDRVVRAVPEQRVERSGAPSLTGTSLGSAVEAIIEYFFEDLRHFIRIRAFFEPCNSNFILCCLRRLQV